MDDPAELTDQQVAQRLEQLRDMEREVSQARASVHRVQDALTGELARRYRDGEAKPEGVLKADS